MTTVLRERRIAASAERVWPLVRDFGGLHEWVPGVPAPAELTGDPEQPGTERVFRHDGEILFAERLVEIDDANHTVHYEISRAPMPLDGHRASISLIGDGDGTLVTWRADFETDPSLVEQISTMMATQTFEPGLEGLARKIEHPADRRAAIHNVLVTAGYGNQARLVIPALAAAGLRVRAMRRSERPAPGPLDLGAVDVIVGDAGDREDAARALDGVDVVYHVGPMLHPREREIGLNVIEQAQAAGVEHFVFSSALHPVLSEMPQHGLKREIEERLIESGMNFTILQPSDYMQMTVMSVLLDQGLYLLSFPPDRRHALVDLADVAEVATKVITEGPAHYGATYELSSADNLNALEIATVLSRILDRPITAQQIESSFEHLAALDDANRQYQTDILTTIFRWYGTHDFIGNPNVLAMLLGREPTSFSSFCARYYAQPRERDPQ